MFCCCRSSVAVADYSDPGDGSLPPLRFRGSGGDEDNGIVPTSIMVVVRVRPMVQREIGLKSVDVVQRTGATTVRSCVGWLGYAQLTRELKILPYS